MGKYLLTSKEIECKWQQTDNVKPVPMNVFLFLDNNFEDAFCLYCFLKISYLYFQMTIKIA